FSFPTAFLLYPLSSLLHCILRFLLVFLDLALVYSHYDLGLLFVAACREVEPPPIEPKTDYASRNKQQYGQQAVHNQIPPYGAEERISHVTSIHSRASPAASAPFIAVA